MTNPVPSTGTTNARLLPYVDDEQIAAYRRAFIEAMRDRMVPFARDGLTHLATERAGLIASSCGHGEVCSYNLYLVNCIDCGGR